MLKTSQPQLCYQCHTKAEFESTSPSRTLPWGCPHPTSGSWDPVANAPLTCTSTCHNPHGSPYYKMLRVAYGSDGMGADYLCLNCHTKVGISY
jgi:predicted CXXCH cytochrome family protein